jgi:hypothetical protein
MGAYCNQFDKFARGRVQHHLLPSSQQGCAGMKTSEDRASGSGVFDVILMHSLT